METERILSSFFKKHAWLFLYIIILGWSSLLFQLNNRYISIIWLKKMLLALLSGLAWEGYRGLRHCSCVWRASRPLEKLCCVGKD